MIKKNAIQTTLSIIFCVTVLIFGVYFCLNIGTVEVSAAEELQGNRLISGETANFGNSRNLSGSNGYKNLPSPNDPLQDFAWSFEQIPGSENTNVYKYSFHSWAVNVSKLPIMFDRRIKASETDGLIIRVFAHLSKGDTYDSTYGGIRLYSTDDQGLSGEGFMIPTNIKQDEWTEILLNKEALSLLANADGYIDGIQLGAAFLVSDESLLHTGIGNSYICIDYIDTAETKTLTFDENTGSANTTQTIYTGMSIEDYYYTPVREGFLFTGWKLNDVVYDFSIETTEDITLKAGWAKAESSTNYVGFYKSESGNISIFDNGSIYAPGVIDSYLSYGFSENKLYITESNYVKIIDLEKYEKVENAKLVVYVTGSEDILRYVEAGGTAENLVCTRPGYIFSGWKNERGGEFDFDEPITVKTRIIASWNYDENVDTDFYHASYYCKDTGEFIVLGENNKLTLDGKEYTYYILSSQELVVETNNKSYGTVFATRIVLGDKIFTRLMRYLVTFDTDGGGEIGTQKIEGGSYKVTQPEDPVRDGYTFQGWYLSDGTKYNFDSVLTESITLHARWEFSEDDNGDKKGCQSTAASTSSGTAGLIAVAIGGIMLKRRSRKA